MAVFLFAPLTPISPKIMPSPHELYQNLKNALTSQELSKNNNYHSGQIREKQTLQLDEDIQGLVIRLKWLRHIRTKKAGEIEIDDVDINNSIYQCIMEKDKPDPDMTIEIRRCARNLTTAIVRSSTGDPLFNEDIGYIDKIEMILELQRTANDYTKHLDKTCLQNLGLGQEDIQIDSD